MQRVEREFFMPQKTGNKKRRDCLVEEYQGYVVNVANKMINRMNLPLNFLDEYIAAGNLGLVEAAERYDSTSGTDFRRYAFLRIRGAIIDNIRKSSELSGRTYRYAKALKAAEDLRVVDEPLLKVTSEEKLSHLFEWASKATLAYRISMADLTPDEEQEHFADCDDPQVILRQKQFSEGMKSLVELLPDNERYIIEGYYFRGLSFREILEESEGMSKSWISKLHSRALGRLKEHLEGAQQYEAA